MTAVCCTLTRAHHHLTTHCEQCGKTVLDVAVIGTEEPPAYRDHALRVLAHHERDHRRRPEDEEHA